MWKWKTVCQAAARQALSRLKPSGSSVASIRLATRWAATAQLARSSSPIDSRSSVWRRGITSAWPLVAGLMSISVTVCSSESTISAGASPATIAQKMQSGTDSGTAAAGYRLRRPGAQVRDRRRRGRRPRPRTARPRARRRPRRAPARARSRPRRRSRRRGAAAPAAPPAPTRPPPPSISRASSRWPLDRLLGHAAALRREPVGDGQQRRVERLRRGPAQVVPDPPRRQRPLADHEAEDEVVAGDRRQVLGEPARGAQPPAEGGGPSRRRAASWPRKLTQPSRSVRVAGLPMSCRSAAKRSPSRRVSSSASGSARSTAPRRRPRSPQ